MRVRSTVTLQSIIDAVPVALGYVDRRERLIAANLAWERLTGLQREPLLGKTLLAVFGKSIYAELRPNMQRAFAGEAVSFERQVVRPDHVARRVQVQYAPDRGSRGAVRGYYYALTDVTEHNAALQERAGRESLLQAVLDVSRAGVAINAPDGTRLDFSDRLCEILGRTRDELARANWISLTHPEDLPRDLANHAKLVTGAIDGTLINKRYLRPDGSIVHARLAIRAIRDTTGALTRVVALVHDVSDLRQAQIDAETAEQRLRLATDAGGTCAWEWDIADDILHWHTPPENLLGPRPASGRYPDFREMVHPDDRDAFLAAGRAVIDRGSEYEFEARLVRTDGKIRWFAARGRLERDSAGQPVRMIGASADIDSRKRAEEALRRSEERFRDLVLLTSDWYWEQDAQFRFTMIEGPVHENTGLADRTFIGKTRWELPILNFSEADWVAHRAMLARHEPFHDLLLRNPDTAEGERWIYTSGKPIHDDRGSFVGYRGVARNATGAVLAERALRESEQRFRSLTELSSDWYWEQDADYRFVSTEGSSLERGGISADAHTGKRRWELPGTEVVGQTWDEHRAELAARRSFTDLLLRRTASDGTIHHVSVSGEPMFDAAGGFLGYRGIARDVSERVALQTRNAALAQAIENAGLALCLCDAEDRIVIANRAFNDRDDSLTRFLQPGGRFVDYLRAGLRIGRYAEAVGREDAWLAERLQRRADGIGIEVRRSDDQWFLVRDDRLPDGGILTIAFDITERKRIEAREAQARDRLRLAVENLNEPIFMTNAEDRFDFVNRRFRELNPGQEHLLRPGQRYADYLRATAESGRRPDAIGREAAWVAERLEQRKHGGGPYTVRRQGGLTLQTYDQKFEDGSTLSYAIDITDRLRAEETLRDANAMLEARVKERTAELESALRELEAFSYSVSHDLRAPLRAINGYSSILLTEEARRLSEDGKRSLDTIVRNASRMGELVDDLLELARINRLELHRQPIDMVALAQAIVEKLRPQYPGARVEIGALPRADGDTVLVRQVLSNLVGNALKYSSRSEAPQIDIRWQAADAAYVVCDNGVGFDMTYAHKLFGTFERLHTPTEFEGTGIGLAIVKRVIDRHGGRVWAQANPGKGARFFFTLGSALTP